MTAPGLTVTWSPRAQPLSAVGAVARGEVVPVLARAVATRTATTGSLRVAAAPGWLLVTGDTADLPWADGVVYLGEEAGLLVPTLDEPVPGAAFLASALPPAPLRVVVPGSVLVATFSARPPLPEQLAALR